MSLFRKCMVMLLCLIVGLSSVGIVSAQTVAFAAEEDVAGQAADNASQDDTSQHDAVSGIDDVTTPDDDADVTDDAENGSVDGTAGDENTAGDETVGEDMDLADGIAAIGLTDTEAVGTEDPTGPETSAPVEKKTVTFDAGGGTLFGGGSEKTVELTDEGTLPDIGTPVRTGWKFAGWYTAPVDYYFWGQKDEWAPGKDLSYGLEPMPAGYGDSIDPYDNKPYDDYDYFSWLSKSDGEKVEAGSKVEEGTKIYARWDPTTVVIRYWYNGWCGGYGTFLNCYRDYGTPGKYEFKFMPFFDGKGNYTETVYPSFVWAGYEMTGWYTTEKSADGEAVDSATNKIDKNTYSGPITKDMDLYAHWWKLSDKDINSDNQNRVVEPDKPMTGVKLDRIKYYMHPGESITAVVYASSGISIKDEADDDIEIEWSVCDAGTDRNRTFSDSDTAASNDIISIAGNGNKAVITANEMEGTDNVGASIMVTVTKGDDVFKTMADVTVRHEWNHSKIVRDSTCTGTGEVEWSCDKCDKKMTREFPADGHRYVLTKVKPTCENDGYIKRYCRVCGEVESVTADKATGHDYSIEKVESGCSGTVTTKTCSKCGDVVITEDKNAASHVKSTEPKTIKKATCSEPGMQAYECEKCGVILETKEIPADDSLHKWGEWTVDAGEKATETKNGRKHRECEVCGASESVVIKAESSVVLNTSDSDNKDKTEMNKALDKGRREAKVDVTGTDERSVIEASVKQLLETSGNSGADSALAGALQRATVVAVGNMETPSVTAAVEKFYSGSAENSRTLEIDIAVKMGDRTLGYLTELSEPISFTVPRSDVGDGRIVTVTREHNGVTDQLPVSVKGDDISFASDKFSSFTISLSNDITNAKASAIPAQKYTGSAVTPDVNVTINGGEKLINGTDYTVSYSNNVEKGTATATVSGINGLTGSKDITFSIVDAGSTGGSDNSGITDGIATADNGSASAAGSGLTASAGSGLPASAGTPADAAKTALNDVEEETGGQNAVLWSVLAALAILAAAVIFFAARRRKADR